MTFRKFWMTVHAVHLQQALRSNYVHVCTALRVQSSGVGWELRVLIFLFITEDKCRVICLSRSHIVNL